VTVKKCDCNFSVKTNVLNFKIKFSGHIFKFGKIHEFSDFLKFIKSRFSIYDWRSAGSLGWPFAKIHGSCLIKQHWESVMV